MASKPGRKIIIKRKQNKNNYN